MYLLFVFLSCNDLQIVPKKTETAHIEKKNAYLEKQKQLHPLGFNMIHTYRQ